MFACIALFKHTLKWNHRFLYNFIFFKPPTTGRHRQNWTGHTYTDTLPINLLQPQSHTHTHTLDCSQSLPSACVCMLAYCTRECVILMCECEWMGVEMSLLIFGKYRRSGCYMLSGPTFLWRKFWLKFVLKVQFGLKPLRALKAKCVFPSLFWYECTWFDLNSRGRKRPSPVQDSQFCWLNVVVLRNTWIKSIGRWRLTHSTMVLFCMCTIV